MIDNRALFSKDDYMHMRFDVMGLKNIVNTVSEFSEADEFQCILPVDIDSAIKYMCLVYDPKSPVPMRITDVNTVRQTAAILAGFKNNDSGNFEPEVERIMKCRNPVFNKMLVRYLRFFNDDYFAMLVTARQALYNKQAMILNAGLELDENNDKSDIEIEKLKGELMKQADAVLISIDNYTNRLLNNDKNPFLRENLFAIVDAEASKPKLKPETQAKRRLLTESGKEV